MDMPKLLADRPLMGYPGVTVELHIAPPPYGVGYQVRCGGETWEVDNTKDAKDIYFHPFCYGYDFIPVPKFLEEDA